jgi:DNA-3-methyladenine glycosylase
MSLSPVVEELFYNRPAVEVARDLLGMRLVRMLDGIRISGTIIETEAYAGEYDLACHARAGLTKRTAVMYGPPGRAYVYFTYGMHWLLNAVCLPEGDPAAVLIRAIEPEERLDVIAARRNGQPPARWTDGPGKICQAFGIDGSLNGNNLADPNSGLWIEMGTTILDEQVRYGPRVGLGNTPEPWKSVPWRFRVRTGIREQAIRD